MTSILVAYLLLPSKGTLCRYLDALVRRSKEADSLTNHKHSHHMDSDQPAEFHVFADEQANI